MEEDITKKPLYEIMTEMQFLEQEIDIKILQYEKLRLEIIRRFPLQSVEETFKPKTYKKILGGKND